MATETGQQTFERCVSVTPLCPVEGTVYGDYFNKGACIFFCALFSAALVFQVVVGYRYKTWSFMSWVAAGLILEVLGYVGRILMVENPWDQLGMRLQLICLLLGPTFIAAAISVTFKHIFIFCGAQYSIIRPKWIPYIFIGSDFVSIVIQAIGGVVASISLSATGSDPQMLMDVGTALLITGVAFQAGNMVLCGGFVLIFIHRYRHAKQCNQVSNVDNNANPTDTFPNALRTKQSRKENGVRHFTIFCSALALAYICIVVRCIYRIPEMSSGWGSDLMQDELTFLLLDGMPLAIASTVLCVIHPGILFPPLRTSRRKQQASRDQATPDQIDAEGVELR